jgi:hypothetical protein
MTNRIARTWHILASGTVVGALLFGAPAAAGGCNYLACSVKAAAFSYVDYNAGGRGWRVINESRASYRGQASRGHVLVYDYPSWFVYGDRNGKVKDVLGTKPWPIPSWTLPYLTRPYGGPTFDGAYPCPYIDSDPGFAFVWVPGVHTRKSTACHTIALSIGRLSTRR